MCALNMVIWLIKCTCVKIIKICLRLLNWLHLFIITRAQLCAEYIVQNSVFLLQGADRHVLFTVMKPVKENVNIF